ncbi:hypothetical protein COW91_01490 [Candidatus Nomurabacteria bacterium CG22_combo_CG10-13_8_21_14_all_32_8]|uniref:Uncharacterized protein n=1 Tax=Candidatus Nomurabacteria bacterium CG22_combo_CG10-13_8_21_14_all_32_8 TaxID=1974732 RepID=A0A2H0CH27_9BACT|nr:MAG: hypothetical protein COW91_01490 [Candidatus Nomurabacteria bacterium CG22_combo_CG10-13_8_21_14_all_32_8]
MKPSYFFDITLPGFPGNKRYQKKYKEEQKAFLAKIIFAKKANPNAKKFCLRCFTPIYEDGGECPNCDN